MLNCQNCGQNNTQSGNFCRFCGTKFGSAQYAAAAYQGISNFEYAPPRPYSWSTGEFQMPAVVTAPPPRPSKTKQIKQVQPLADFRTQRDFQLQTFQQPAALDHGFHCPRCSSRLLPRVSKQISTGGWIVFAVLLVTFFPLFWIGFMIKEEVRTCAACNLKFS